MAMTKLPACLPADTVLSCPLWFGSTSPKPLLLTKITAFFITNTYVNKEPGDCWYRKEAWESVEGQIQRTSVCGLNLSSSSCFGVTTLCEFWPAQSSVSTYSYFSACFFQRQVVITSHSIFTSSFHLISGLPLGLKAMRFRSKFSKLADVHYFWMPIKRFSTIYSLVLAYMPWPQYSTETVSNRKISYTIQVPAPSVHARDGRPFIWRY